jgi:hypothetical protein
VFRMASGLMLRSHRGGGHGSESCSGSGVDRIFGCSYQGLVAQVGEKHLPRAVEVSRKVSQGDAG